MKLPLEENVAVNDIKRDSIKPKKGFCFVLIQLCLLISFAGLKIIFGYWIRSVELRLGGIY